MDNRFATTRLVQDGGSSPAVETVEREELFDALDAIVDEVGLESGDAVSAQNSLREGVESVRDW